MIFKARTYLIIATALFLGTTTGAITSNAQEIAEQPCSTQFWRQMSARASMEAEREIMMNQNLIFKADSVLEYTCFDQLVNLTAWRGGQIFTHTDYFGEQIIGQGSNQGLPISLNNVVYTALVAYVDNNFGHSYLGGRAQRLAAENRDSQFLPPVAEITDGYNCNAMANVWQAAKCSNFIDNDEFQNTDGFYPFETIAGMDGNPDVVGYNDPSIQDTRHFPTRCTAAGATVDLGPMGTWDTQIALANNEDLYEFQAPLRAVYTEVGDKLRPQVCNDPIKTGVKVFVSDDESYDDAVCTNPGCFYNRENGTCTSSASTGEPGTSPTIPETPNGAF